MCIYICMYVYVYRTYKYGKKLFISCNNMGICYLSVTFSKCHLTIKCRTEMQSNNNTTIKTQNNCTINVLHKQQYNFCF